MMAFVPRIAVAPQLGAAPFIFGIRHALHGSAEWLSLSPAECITAFTNRQVDIALIPADAWPRLTGARIITEYCVGAQGASEVANLLCNDEIRQLRRVWISADYPTALQLGAWLLNRSEGLQVEFCTLDDPETQIAHISAQPGEGVILSGVETLEYGDLFENCHDLSAWWHEVTGLPFVWALWVARPELDPEVIEAFSLALTEGVERGYEATIAYASEQGSEQTPERLYELGMRIDYLFDVEKDRALQKFWDSGLKASLHSNPG